MCADTRVRRGRDFSEHQCRTLCGLTVRWECMRAMCRGIRLPMAACACHRGWRERSSITCPSEPLCASNAEGSSLGLISSLAIDLTRGATSEWLSRIAGDLELRSLEPDGTGRGAQFNGRPRSPMQVVCNGGLSLHLSVLFGGWVRFPSATC